MFAVMDVLIVLNTKLYDLLEQSEVIALNVYTMLGQYVLLLEIVPHISQ
jgi:hypothetical protein